MIKDSFKGFVSNRFGRLGELLSMFVNHKLTIDSFFEYQVDIRTNKLVLAVHAYYNSTWFSLFCKVGSIFYKKVTIPINRVLGIDEHKDTSVSHRSWGGKRQEFNTIIQNLKCMMDEINNSTSGVK